MQSRLGAGAGRPGSWEGTRRAADLARPRPPSSPWKAQTSCALQRPARVQGQGRYIPRAAAAISADTEPGSTRPPSPGVLPERRAQSKRVRAPAPSTAPGPRVRTAAVAHRVQEQSARTLEEKPRAGRVCLPTSSGQLRLLNPRCSRRRYSSESSVSGEGSLGRGAPCLKINTHFPWGHWYLFYLNYTDCFHSLASEVLRLKSAFPAICMYLFRDGVALQHGLLLWQLLQNKIRLHQGRGRKPPKKARHWSHGCGCLFRA